MSTVAAGFTVIALTYGALGLLLGVLRNDLEGFFLIIMTSLMDTFLQKAGQPASQQAGAGMVPVFRAHSVRCRRRFRPHRPVTIPGPWPGLARRLRRNRADHLPDLDPRPDLP